MSDTTTPPAETVEKPTEETPEVTEEVAAATGDKQAAATAEVKAGDEETPPGEGDDADSKLSHKDALEALAKVRKEAAASRTRLREAEDKLKEAKTPEEFEAARQELAQANATDARNLLVENVALKANLPPELADALKGETREELEAHAKVLAKFVPKDDEPGDDPDLSGGLEPGNNPDAFDPKAHTPRARRRRR